jgi:tRNA (guanine10-N2)-dimethyltransferase
VVRIFFIVSGENPTLPYSEVKSILAAEGYPHQVLEELTQVLRVEADVKCVEAVGFRSALAKYCCLEIFKCKSSLDEILSNVRSVDFTELTSDGETFVVRVFKIRGVSPHIDCLALERRIGGIIYEYAKSRRVKVNLKKPDKVFLGFLTDNVFLFGLGLAELSRKNLMERNPSRRVFFHPAALTAKMARCMVNLAQARVGEIVLDPFCGTGSILIEAGLMRCKAIGLDAKKYMVKGSLKNLELFGVKPECLGVADARFPPLAYESVDRIVTDPPYGTSATTLGLSMRKLVEQFFSSAIDIIRDGGMICIASPSTLGISEIGRKHGFKHIESHFIYVHRRLTREIAVFKKP